MPASESRSCPGVGYPGPPLQVHGPPAPSGLVDLCLNRHDNYFKAPEFRDKHRPIHAVNVLASRSRNRRADAAKRPR